MPGGVAHRREAAVDEEATPEREPDVEQEAADQQVAVKESHEAIGREEIPDERGESPDVDEAAVSAEDEAAFGKAKKTVQLGGGTHTVTKKDTLWEISKATYGHGKYWKKVRAANPGKVTARQNGVRDLIHTGDELALPMLEIPPSEAFAVFAAEDPVLADFGDDRDDAQKLQLMELAQTTGMTRDEMAAEQRRYWETQAAAAGLTVPEYLEEQVKADPVMHSTSLWDAEVDLGADNVASWKARCDAVGERVKMDSRPEVVAAFKEAEAKGGGKVVWDPVKIEKRNAFALGGDWNIAVGMQWVISAEADLESVAASVFHELLGHATYGTRNAAAIMGDAFGSLDREERDQAPNGRYIWAKGDWESEIFAELYEFTYDSRDQLTDHAFEVDPSGNDLTNAKHPRIRDVKGQLENAKAYTAPTLLPALVKALWHRIQNDPRILDQARELFLRDVREVLGDIL